MFTEQEINTMKQMRAEGYKLEYIALKMKCSRSYVDRLTSEYNKTKHKSWTKDDIQKLVTLRKEGTSFEELSNILNRSIESCKTKYYISHKLEEFNN